MAQADVLTPAGEVRTRQGTFPNRLMAAPFFATPETVESRVIYADSRPGDHLSE
jgi:hypothetical protein